ncbi:lasso peptide biosynthesis B2 protein [Sphingomonas oryzagri]
MASGRRPSSADEIVLARLASKGILVHRPGAAPVKLGAQIADAESGAFTEAASGRGIDICSMLWEVAIARIHLRFRSLQHILDGIRDAKLRLAASRQSETSVSLSAVAGALAKVDVMLSGHDRCLQRSIAVMRFLMRRGHRADMVFGVTGRPFQAHSWVQMNEVVVTDTPEHVRLFTPILVL